MKTNTKTVFMFMAFLLTLTMATAAYAYNDLRPEGDNRWSVGIAPIMTFPEDANFDTGFGADVTFDYEVFKFVKVGVEGFYTANKLTANGKKYGVVHDLAFLGNLTLQIPFEVADHKIALYSINGIGFLTPVVSRDDENSQNLDTDNMAIAKFGGGLEIGLSDHLSLKFEGGYVWDFTKTNWTLSTDGFDDMNVDTGFIYAGLVLTFIW